MRLFVRVATLAVVLLGLCAASPAQERSLTLDDLAWLAGCWEHATPRGMTEEQWMKPSGGSMIGMSRTVHEGRTRWHEFLQIRQRGDTLLYIAHPSGQEETAFMLTRHSGGEYVFENPDHDFPQRIIYMQMDDGTLRARIEGTINGKERVEHFPYKRVACE